MRDRRKEKWYAVSFRAEAECVAMVLAETPDEARMRAEDGEYAYATPVAFLRGRPRTTKVRLAPETSTTENPA